MGNLKKFLDNLYAETPFDLANTDSSAKQIAIYKGSKSANKLIGKIAQEGNINENGFIKPEALRKLLTDVTTTFRIDGKVVNDFLNTYKKGIPFDNNIVELEINNDQIILNKIIKDKAVASSSPTPAPKPSTPAITEEMFENDKLETDVVVDGKEVRRRVNIIRDEKTREMVAFDIIDTFK